MKYLLICTAMTVLFLGCKHDSPSPALVSTTKTTLLQKASYEINGSSFTELYRYDDKNRVIYYYDGPGYCIYKYTYNTNNQVATVLKYQQNDTTLIESDTYAYNGNNVTITYNTGGTCNVVLNADQLATSACNGQSYVYDSNQNITRDNMTSSQTNYLYDKKKHPLSTIGAPNLHLMYFALGYAQTFKNNPTSRSSTYDGSNVTYKYVYNANGFPVKATVTTNSETYIIYYTYITGS